MPKLPGIPISRQCVPLEKAGFRVVREGKHIVMSKGQRILTIPRANPVSAFTMGGLVRDAGLTIEQFRKLSEPPRIPGTIVAGICTGSVADYCAHTAGPCPPFEAAVARRRTLCSQRGSWAVEERRCAGQFSSVSWREALLGGGEEFFAGNGQLIGAQLCTDYPAFCGGQSFSQVFGSVPACPEEVVSTSMGERKP